MESTIKIRFITEKDPIAGAIRFITHAPKTAPSHAEFELSDGTFLGAHAGGGVQIRKPDYTKTSWDRRYAIPVAQKQYDDVMAFAHAQIGKPYDFSDIVGILLDQNWHCTSKWICSELVLASLLNGGVEFLNVQAGYCHRIDPDRLHLSPLLIGTLYYEAVDDIPVKKA